MIQALSILNKALLDRLKAIEERVEKLRLTHRCAGDACAVCALLDDIIAG